MRARTHEGTQTSELRCWSQSAGSGGRSGYEHSARNNVIEQDHRFIKKRIAASLWFRSAEGASRTIDGYEAMHLIRKGQIRWLPKGDVVGQRRFIHTLFGIAA